MQQQGWFIKIFKGDRVIWGLVVIFMFYSLLAVYSASSALATLKHDGNTTYFFWSQFMLLSISMLVIVLIHYLPCRIYFSLASLFLLIALALLVFTLFSGKQINDATRWITIFGISIQPSEIAKAALVIYLARSLAFYQDEKNNFMQVTKYFMIPVVLICGLIMTENLSTSIMIFGISLIIMFIGRIPFRFLLTYIGIALAAILLMVALFKAVPGIQPERYVTWEKRIETFFSKEKDADADINADYQITQAKIAISTGGLFGKGPGKSEQRNILPQSNSDFIFAIIIEEYGLIFGAIPLILAYMILLFRGITIVKKCETAFPAYLVMGLIIMIVVQATLNMLVAVGIFPVTGQTLPMVSWGRTSALVMSFSIGAILSVSRVINARAKKEELQDEEKIDIGEKIYEPAKA